MNIKDFKPEGLLSGDPLPPDPGQAPDQTPPPAQDPLDVIPQDPGPDPDREQSDPKTFTPDPVTVDGPDPDPIPQQDRSTPKMLRDEIKQRNADIERLRQELEAEKGRKRPDLEEVERLRGELDGLKGERQRELDSRNRQNAANHPEVEAIKRPFNEKAVGIADGLSFQGKDGQKFIAELGTMIGDMAELGSPQSAGYNERRSALLEKVEEYGSENRSEIYSLLQQGIKTLHEANNKQKEVAENALAYTFKERQINYGKHLQGFKALADGWGNISDVDADADPLKPASIIHRMAKEIPEVKQADAQVRNLLERAFVPPPPLDPAEETIVGPQVWQERIQTMLSGHNQAKAAVIGGARDAFVALRLMPGLVKRITELEGQLKSRRAEAPKVEPSDHRPADPDEQEPTGARSARDFKPQPVAI